MLDAKNDYWMRNGFDHGRVWLIFMVRDGKLSAFDGAYRPVGEPIALGFVALRRRLAPTPRFACDASR